MSLADGDVETASMLTLHFTSTWHKSSKNNLGESFVYLYGASIPIVEQQLESLVSLVC